MNASEAAQLYYNHAETCSQCLSGNVGAADIETTCALGASYVALYHSYKLIDAAKDMQAALRTVVRESHPLK